MKQLAQANNIGISFEEDCIIGAEDVFERWVCQNRFLAGLAREGILTEMVIVVGVVVLALLVIVVYKKYRNKIK